MKIEFTRQTDGSLVVHRLWSGQSTVLSFGCVRRRTPVRYCFKDADLVTQTLGVEYRKDPAVLDELTQAYKNIEQVMRDQEDWVEGVYQLNQVICVKGA